MFADEFSTHKAVCCQCILLLVVIMPAVCCRIVLLESSEIVQTPKSAFMWLKLISMWLFTNNCFLRNINNILRLLAVQYFFNGMENIIMQDAVFISVTSIVTQPFILSKYVLLLQCVTAKSIQEL